MPHGWGGLFLVYAATDSGTEEIRDTFDLNVIAACVCTREAIRQMRERGASGHVVIINRYVMVE